MIDVLSVVLNAARDEQKFNEMWAAVVREAGTIGVEEPVLHDVSGGHHVGKMKGHNHTRMKVVNFFTEEFIFQWSMVL